MAALIRRGTPRTVAIPYWEDRHPDHGAASRVLTEAIFNSRLRRYPLEGDPWAPEWVCYYFINDQGPISFAIDVSTHYDASSAPSTATTASSSRPARAPSARGSRRRRSGS